MAEDRIAAVRLVRGRVALLNRSEVGDWASTTGAAQGTELARHTLSPAGEGTSVPFQLTVPAEELRLPRSYGAIPIAVEVVTIRGVSVAVTRTFVGWQRSGDYVPLSVAWILPLTLGPDPGLLADDSAARTSAWEKQIGPHSRLTSVLSATAEATVGYAVDPALLGPTGRTAAQDAADPASALRADFALALQAAARQHPVFALPYADPDIAALTSPELPPTIAAAATRLLDELVGGSGRLADQGVTVAGTLAWPADGALTQAREMTVRTAYGSRLGAVLASAQATDPTARLTPMAQARTMSDLPVLRWDDQLSTLANRLGSPADGVLATQEFIAQTVALLGERPSIPRTVLVVPPREVASTVDSGVLARFLEATASVPWIRLVGPDAVLRPGPLVEPTVLPELPFAAPPQGTAGPGGSDGAPAGAGPDQIARLLEQRSAIATMAEVLGPTSPTVARWADLPVQLASTRWRANPAGRETLLARVDAATSTLSRGVTLTPSTTNFLADEGVLQLTVVNTLDEPVRGVRAILQPGNGRIVVIEPAAPVDIAPNAKGTVTVRLAAVAQGLVPVNAWLTTRSGTKIGQTEQLTIRAAPPGAWLYVGLGTVCGLILLVGIVRAVRRPPRQVIDVTGLDPVEPTPEPPLVAPIEHRPAP